LPQAGHFAFLDQPDQVMAKIDGFLKAPNGLSMSEDQPPSLAPLAPAPDAALVIRERGAELLPHRRSRLVIRAGIVVAGLGVVGAVIVSGSALPFLLLGPLMAGGLLLARRAEPSAARRRFERVPLIAAAAELVVGARVRLRGRVVGALSPVARLEGQTADAPVMMLQSAGTASGELAAIELRGQDFLMISDAGVKVAVLIHDGWLFDDQAAAQAARGELRPVSVQPGDQVEVVGAVGRVIHVEGEPGLGRTPPSIAALASTEQDPLLVRKL
jgi:hypothetical protein